MSASHGRALLLTTLFVPILLPLASPALASRSPSFVSTLQAKLTANDAAASDHFGQSLGLSGSTAVVGAPRDDHVTVDAGSAYVFVRSGGTWAQQARLTASDAAASDNFGTAVAIDGDYAVVGANLDNHASTTDPGSVYVFVRVGTTWSQQTRLFATDAAANDQFGTSVAIAGSTIVVGAPRDDLATGSDAGSAYVFVRFGTTWTQQAKLTAQDAATGDNFGASVALSGGTAVVGAPGDDHAAIAGAGSAYVFAVSGSVWSQQQKLTASDASASDAFGIHVAISGTTALIGAILDDDAAGADAGAAYAYVRSGTVWSEEAKLVASNGQPGDHFGVVALAGDRALIGAPLSERGQGSDAGSAYVFNRSGTVWVEESPQVIAPDAAAADRFGTAVAISGATGVVSAPLHDLPDAGSAYVFDVLRSVPGIGSTGLVILSLSILLAAALRLRPRSGTRESITAGRP